MVPIGAMGPADIGTTLYPPLTLFTDKGSDIDITCLESGMSFLQVKSSMTMKEKLRHVRSAICMKRIEIAHTRLEAIAGWTTPIA